MAAVGAVFWLLIATLMGAEAFWWPFSSDSEGGSEQETAVASREPVAFEMASAEQKFLAEAQQFLNVPPLEACQYKVSSHTSCRAWWRVYCVCRRL